MTRVKAENQEFISELDKMKAMLEEQKKVEDGLRKEIKDFEKREISADKK